MRPRTGQGRRHFGEFHLAPLGGEARRAGECLKATQVTHKSIYMA